MTGWIAWPDAGDVLIRHATVPGCLLDPQQPNLVHCDILVASGVVAAIGPALQGDAAIVDVGGGLVFPGFVDMHTHLDKGHIWPRASNKDGTHLAAQLAVKADREANWSAEDVAARANFSLRCAFAYGTVAIRTHLDSLGDQLDVT
jgi:cytosine deaminase